MTSTGPATAKPQVNGRPAIRPVDTPVVSTNPADNDKGPKPYWFRAFVLVAGEGFEPTTSGYEHDEQAHCRPGIMRVLSIHQGKRESVGHLWSRLFPPVYGYPASSVRHGPMRFVAAIGTWGRVRVNSEP